MGETVDIKFTTRQVSGAPFTLAGSPVISAYPSNSTTQLTAGITLSVDFDSVTGLNNCRVVATSGNGYATATNYALVITTGTVNSVSVVGEVIGSFSIEARSALMPTTAARTLDVTAANKVNGVVTTDVLTTYTGNTPQTGDSFARIGANGASLTALATQTSVNTVDDLIDTEVGAIKTVVDAIQAKTDNLPSDPADQSLVIAATNAIAALLGSPAGASLSVDLAAVKAQTAAIETDTQDLQSRTPAALVGGRTDSSLGAIAVGVDLSATMKTSVTTAATAATPALSAAGVDAILDDPIGDGTITARQALRAILAGMGAKLAGAGTATITIRNVADSANVWVVTVDGAGNRTASVLTP